MSRKSLLIWLCALAGLLIVNTIAHISSPAYSAYRDNLSYAQSQLHSLSNALLRFNAILATNMMAEVGRTVDLKARPALSTAPGVDASAAAPGAAGRDDARLDSVSLPADAYPYLVNGCYYVRICGWDYTLGDSFSGSPIVDINPLEFRTLSTVYKFSSARSSTTIQKKERLKNGSDDIRRNS